MNCDSLQIFYERVRRESQSKERTPEIFHPYKGKAGGSDSVCPARSLDQRAPALSTAASGGAQKKETKNVRNLPCCRQRRQHPLDVRTRSLYGRGARECSRVRGAEEMGARKGAPTSPSPRVHRPGAAGYAGNSCPICFCRKAGKSGRLPFKRHRGVGAVLARLKRPRP